MVLSCLQVRVTHAKMTLDYFRLMHDCPLHCRMHINWSSSEAGTLHDCTSMRINSAFESKTLFCRRTCTIRTCRVCTRPVNASLCRPDTRALGCRRLRQWHAGPPLLPVMRLVFRKWSASKRLCLTPLILPTSQIV